MICRACTEGAKKQVNARTETGTVRTESVRAAKRWHGRCKGCSCQHRVILDRSELLVEAS
jgi:hypothetical protein